MGYDSINDGIETLNTRDSTIKQMGFTNCFSCHEMIEVSVRI